MGSKTDYVETITDILNMNGDLIRSSYHLFLMYNYHNELLSPNSKIDYKLGIRPSNSVKLIINQLISTFDKAAISLGIDSNGHRTNYDLTKPGDKGIDGMINKFFNIMRLNEFLYLIRSDENILDNPRNKVFILKPSEYKLNRFKDVVNVLFNYSMNYNGDGFDTLTPTNVALILADKCGLEIFSDYTLISMGYYNPGLIRNDNRKSFLSRFKYFKKSKQIDIIDNSNMDRLDELLINAKIGYNLVLNTMSSLVSDVINSGMRRRITQSVASSPFGRSLYNGLLNDIIGTLSGMSGLPEEMFMIDYSNHYYASTDVIADNVPMVFDNGDITHQHIYPPPIGIINNTASDDDRDLTNTILTLFTLSISIIIYMNKYGNLKLDSETFNVLEIIDISNDIAKDVKLDIEHDLEISDIEIESQSLKLYRNSKQFFRNNLEDELDNMRRFGIYMMSSMKNVFI